MTQIERINTDFSASQKSDAFLQIQVQNPLIQFQIHSISDFVYFYYMTSMISEGVKVSVETFYQADYSNPLQSEFMFAYRIALENHNAFPVKLHRRHWFIFDSNGSHREVEGEGVVGVQPTIQPGENYQYVSGCNLRTEMGRMNGTYQMENLHSKKMFDVSIPSFEMIVPMKNN